MRFKDFLMYEASYVGNIGMMEMFRFYQIASEEQKAHMKSLISKNKHEEAWKFLQQVTKTKLMPSQATVA